MMPGSPLPLGSRHAGIGFRGPHFTDLIAARPAVGFLEVHAENYFCGGPYRRQLEVLRAGWPISLHGVGLSLGSAGGIDAVHLARFADLVHRLEPALISEHLAWSVNDGRYLNDLLPLPYTEESLAVVAANIGRAQDRLKRRLLIENPSAYLRFAHSTIAEAEFLAELVRRSGCGLLFDVNNVFVSCRNLGGDPGDWLAALPADAVGQLHLAGHAVNDADGTPILIDDHGSPVSAQVWELYARAVRRFPTAPALIEWDANLPDLAVLVAEAAHADAVRGAALLAPMRMEMGDADAA